MFMNRYFKMGGGRIVCDRVCSYADILWTQRARIMLSGIALFSSLIHVKKSKIIWLLGGLVLFAGIYFSYNADGVEFLSKWLIDTPVLL